MPASRLIGLIWLLAVNPLTPAQADSVYRPDKVVYDLSSPDPKALENLLDRVGALQSIYGNDLFEASIVIVVHEGALPLFARHESRFQKQLMQRAESLALGEIIRFRLCEMSARIQGLRTEDFPAFTVWVPMADAEIVHLQHSGHAYLR